MSAWHFYFIALSDVGSAVAAMSLRNLVHCALTLAVTLPGWRGSICSSSAQFVGFAQVLVYIGAVAILIVFAILLTRGQRAGRQGRMFVGRLVVGARDRRIAFVVAGGAILGQQMSLPAIQRGQMHLRRR